MKKLILTFSLFAAFMIVVNGQVDTTTYTKVGDKAPAFVCKTIDGKTIDISKQHGKIVMINFFATWCGPCNMELPVVQKNIWEKYKDNSKFVLVMIAREHSEQEVRDFVTLKKFKMPFAADSDRKIYKLYASQTIPRNYIIGKDGRIIYQGIGYTEEEFKEIEAIISEKLK
ncbi:MAG TPA: TlpA disulfide reductase family protein [Bacteroidales bacterium]|nr:TlpA disulfide reductase family protein [Bacteroidales bacterium]HPT22565.1 TlpA disulfide reductase family protein [Bacteroidales bacterium]